MFVDIGKYLDKLLNARIRLRFLCRVCPICSHLRKYIHIYTEKSEKLSGKIPIMVNFGWWRI